MNQQLVPVLNAAGFASSDTPFRREQARYEFRRWRPERAQVVAVLFNRKREALFSVQLYNEPRQGLQAIVSSGDVLRVAGLSAARAWWPRGVVPFRAAPTLFDRLNGDRGIDVMRPIQRFAALLPDAERWFSNPARSRHIVDGRLELPRRA